MARATRRSKACLVQPYRLSGRSRSSAGRRHVVVEARRSRRRRSPRTRHRPAARHGWRTSARCAATTRRWWPRRASPSRRVVLADGAQVVDHLQRRAAVEEAVDLVGRQQPRRRMLGQVAPFPSLPRLIDDDGLEAAAHQGRLQVRADEAGAARDQDHGARYTGRGESAEGASPMG